MNERARSFSVAISREPLLTNFRLVPFWMVQRLRQIAGKRTNHAVFAILAISNHWTKFGAVLASCEKWIAAHFVCPMREQATLVKGAHLALPIGVAGDRVKFGQKNKTLILVLRVGTSKQVGLRGDLCPLACCSFA